MRIKRLAGLTIALLVGLCIAAVSASAHVTVTAPGATSGGGDQEISFRVPVEKLIDTVGLTVLLPTDTPIASVLVEPIAGWSHTQKSATLAKPIVTDDGDITSAVTQITWKAESGHGLKPGEFGVFTIIAGQLPVAKSLTFDALQTYSDGSVVKWDETPAPGSTNEPDNPAPTLDLASTATATTKVAKQASSSSTSGTAGIVIGIIALVVAVGTAGLLLATRRRPLVTT